MTSYRRESSREPLRQKTSALTPVRLRLALMELDEGQGVAGNHGNCSVVPA